VLLARKLQAVLQQRAGGGGLTLRHAHFGQRVQAIWHKLRFLLGDDQLGEEVEHLRLRHGERQHPRTEDQLLHPDRGVARRDGLNLDDRRGELREHVQGRVAHLDEAEPEERRGAKENEPPEPQAA